jgi:hypothetical protein
MDRRAAAFGAANSERAKRKTMAAIKYLATITPVDTSRALSNWQVNLGEPAAVGRGPFYPGLAGSTAEASTAATIAYAEAVLQNKKPGQPIYISNVLPYIRALNDGSSTQHPGGFIEAAMLLIRTTK